MYMCTYSRFVRTGHGSDLVCNKGGLNGTAARTHRSEQLLYNNTMYHKYHTEKYAQRYM